MNQKELLKYLTEKTGLMVTLAEAKNSDYAGDPKKDAFANFTRVEQLGFATTEQGFLTRITDKICRLGSFVENKKLMVKTESVHDTCLDLANYALLFSAYVASKEKEKSKAKDG